MRIYRIYNGWEWGPEVELINENASDADWDTLVKNHPDYDNTSAFIKGCDKSISINGEEADDIFLYTDRILNEYGQDEEDLRKLTSERRVVSSIDFDVKDNEINCIVDYQITTINGLDEVVKTVHEEEKLYRLSIWKEDNGDFSLTSSGAHRLAAQRPMFPFPKGKLMENIGKCLNYYGTEYLPPRDIVFKAIGEKV